MDTRRDVLKKAVFVPPAILTLLPGSKAHQGMSLTDAVRFGNSTTPSNNSGPSQSDRNSLPLNAQVGGALSPTWVEWLMGFPLGWTDLGA